MATSIYSLVKAIIFAFGQYFIFKKSKINKWMAFIPFISKYYLAKAADREDDAIVWSISRFFSICFFLAYSFADYLGRSGDFFAKVCYMIAVVFEIVYVIYEIRIFLGLCQLYNRKKSWIILWIIFEEFVALYWGLSPKFQPSYIPGENDDEAKADEVSVGKDVSTLKEGLTINIKKRTARKKFKTKVMLRDIHLSIEPGKMVLLLGGSGAGKTTLLNAITGYEKADATITLNGTNVYERFDKMQYEIGFVPQQDLMRTNDTVYRTLMDAANLRLPTSVSKKEKEKRVEEVMELLGLSGIRDNIIARQSGGQKKRISIAMEYISDPSLFILDEPDSGLDGIVARELMQSLHNISREGKIVIVITHTPDRVIDLFDQVMVLGKDSKRTGRLVYFGDIDDAKKYFERDTMEEIVRVINRPDEGGEGRTDELADRFAEERNDG